MDPRRRRQLAGSVPPPPPIWKLIVMLGAVLFLIWYLARVA
ncbi:MAG: hypothetical protein ACREMQ_24440 [Longimicrobiales bacterium]